MVADLLAELGHAVVSASNGAEAVELCEREAPDLLVLDFLMPRLSGLDALAALRRRGVRAPAVLLSAISDSSLRAVDGAEAADVVLEKPVTRRALERAIARAARLRDAR
jgi:CheY-like chemotaxis protein